ncbi:MAG: 50S ribosomal protein L9 [Lachnospiraceae bacterium]|nr:50S ribosomal protein L9 [Lachnospiraceae bacterium]
MQVILLEDIKNVGKKGDEVTLKDGYARNLISKKQVVEATPKNRNDLKLQQAHDKKMAEERLKEAQELAEKLSGMSVTVGLKVGKDGRIFGSVSSKEIAEACRSQLNLDVDKKKLVLPEPVKELGKITVPLKLHPQVTASINVIVTEE